MTRKSRIEAVIERAALTLDRMRKSGSTGSADQVVDACFSCLAVEHVISSIGSWTEGDIAVELSPRHRKDAERLRRDRVEPYCLQLEGAADTLRRYCDDWTRRFGDVQRLTRAGGETEDDRAIAYVLAGRMVRTDLHRLRVSANARLHRHEQGWLRLKDERLRFDEASFERRAREALDALNRLFRILETRTAPDQ